MTIKIEGMAEVTKKLESLNRPGVFKAPMALATTHLLGKMKKSPTKAAGAFSRYATKGQKAAYWAKVRDNPAIHGPHGYRRSGRLHRGWVKKIEANGRRGVVENAVSYATYVQGLFRTKGGQQRFHAESRFPAIDRIAKEEAPHIVNIFKRHYDRLVK